MRRLVVVVVASLAILVGQRPASAQSCSDHAGFRDDGVGEVGVECGQADPAADDDSDGDEAAGGQGYDQWMAYVCLKQSWVPGGYVELDRAFRSTSADGRVTDHFTVRCFNPGGVLVYQWNYLVVPVRDLGAEAVAVRDDLLVRLQARVTAPEPVVGSAPPVDGTHLVGMTTWFWVQDTSFGAMAATEVHPAGLTLTLRAEPVALRFDPDDGEVTGNHEVVHCRGAGVQWRSGMRDDETDCQWFWDYPSYLDPDGDGTFEVRAEADWAFTWEASGDLAAYLPAATGTLGTVTVASAPVSITVVEAQAVLVN